MLDSRKKFVCTGKETKNITRRVGSVFRVCSNKCVCGRVRACVCGVCVSPPLREKGWEGLLIEALVFFY